MAKQRLGVGFIGGGPVTQAIHLPTLARLSEDFEVVRIFDVNAEIAAGVAARVGATSGTDLESLLADPRVDVVAVCSPHAFHADQVAAACRAGKKAVLCEKPFAMTEQGAQETAAVAEQTGTPLVVGAMHTFDPAWLFTVANWGDLPDTCTAIRSTIVLPPNPRFEDLATEVITRPGHTTLDLSGVETQASLVHAGVMGLAIHNLPLVRALLPDHRDLQVLSAHVVAPFGYQIVAVAGGRRLELHAVMSATWRPEWLFEAVAPDRVARIQFTPSYVHAGSGVATLHTPGRAVTYGPATHNGYEGEWRAIAAIVRGEQPVPPVQPLVDDLSFAVALADAAAAAVRSQGGQKGRAA